MNYHSLEFLFFVAFFLLVYYTIGRKYQKLVLLGANITFYACAGMKYIPIFAITMVVSFLSGKKMGEIYGNADEKIALCKEASEKKEIRATAKQEAKKILQLAMFVTILLLVACKYTGFIISNVNAVLSLIRLNLITGFEMILPLGISFYSFMTLSYVLDVYWKRYPAEDSFLNYAFYLSYFPHVAQGPIDRFGEFKKQICGSVAFDYRSVCFGAQLMLWGFFKKLVIADRLGLFVERVMGSWYDQPGLVLFLAMAVFSIQIYADFSGCIDIVSGVSEMFGIRLRKNFNHPYFSRTMAEFWRRWHISLQEWFKDYVYFPVSSSALLKKMKKEAKNRFGIRASELVASCFPILVVWLITGIWHGAAWKYVMWGLFHAALLIGSQFFASSFKKGTELLRINTETRSWKFFQILRTFTLCSLGRVFFRSERAVDALYIMQTIFTDFDCLSLFQIHVASRIDLLVSIVSISLLFIVDLVQERTSVRELMEKQNIVVRWTAIFVLLFAVILMGIYGPGYDASSFIYGQF